MFANVVVANRGEIACRIFRTARRMGLRTIALHTPADRGAMFTREADVAIEIGEGSAGYLDAAAILSAAQRAGAECLHPGYGFLSENAEFAEQCAAAGIAFVGPPPQAMRAMGLKSAAKAAMVKAGAPVVPGYHGEEQGPAFLKRKAEEIGYPVLIKAIAGGGGRGMRRVDAPEAFEAALESAQREGKSAFGDPRVLIEKYILSPRHIEVQVFGDSHGHVVHLMERDCSLQRRHQKVIEETPAPGLPDATRAAMCAAAVTAAKAVGYVGAGTVEFIVDASRGLGPDCFYFLEMNTRLQVEHPVTEAILGLDLVEWQLRVAAGEPLPLQQEQIRHRGAAVEARLCAEDPENGFLPSPGRLLALSFAAGQGLRIDAGVAEGDSVTPFYDSMIAKLIVHAPTRSEAFARLDAALLCSTVIGPKTNIAFLSALLNAPEVKAGTHDTGFIDAHLESLGAAPTPPEPSAALAAAAALWNARVGGKSDARDPWLIDDAFDLSGSRRTAFEARIDGKVETLVVEHRARETKVSFRDGRAQDEHGGAPVVRLVSGGAFGLARGRQCFVELVDPLSASIEDAAASGEISAPMHGRLIAVFVEEGQAVKQGARLAVVEAMKMEHALTAPHDGVVRDLAAKAGDSVQQGQRLLSVAPE